VTAKVPAVVVEIVKVAVPLDRVTGPNPVKVAAGPDDSVSVTPLAAFVARFEY